jgi:hypothetical protein
MHGLWYCQSLIPCIKWQEEESNTQLSVVEVAGTMMFFGCGQSL